jgi:hypothetical protein
MSGFDLLGSLSGSPGHDDVGSGARCSRKGCHQDAVWRIEWNNPRIHTPERRKVWLACDEHREYLSHFLDLRGFLKDVTSFRPVPHQSTDEPDKDHN